MLPVEQVRTPGNPEADQGFVEGPGAPLSPRPAGTAKKPGLECRMSPKDAALVAGLCAGLTRREAAAAAGVSLRTVARRVSDPAFQRELAELRAEAFRQAAGRLGAIAAKAAATLEELLGPDFSPMVRLGSSRAILELGTRLFEAGELAERVSRLERALIGGAG